MRTILKYTLLSVFAVGALSIVSCQKDDPEDPERPDLIRSYSGAGSHGDLVTFDVNKTDETYTVYNETTGKTESGSFEAIASGEMEGIWEVDAGGQDLLCG